MNNKWQRCRENNIGILIYIIFIILLDMLLFSLTYCDFNIIFVLLLYIVTVYCSNEAVVSRPLTLQIGLWRSDNGVMILLMYTH